MCGTLYERFTNVGRLFLRGGLEAICLYDLPIALRRYPEKARLVTSSRSACYHEVPFGHCKW